jgi:hypothetical protein
MPKLTAKKRNALPERSFAEPGKRKYPIENSIHAKNALARVSQFGTEAEKNEVRAKVHARYPNIGKKTVAKKRGKSQRKG